MVLNPASNHASHIPFGRCLQSLGSIEFEEIRLKSILGYRIICIGEETKMGGVDRK